MDQNWDIKHGEFLTHGEYVRSPVDFDQFPASWWRSTASHGKRGAITAARYFSMFHHFSGSKIPWQTPIKVMKSHEMVRLVGLGWSGPFFRDQKVAYLNIHWKNPCFSSRMILSHSPSIFLFSRLHPCVNPGPICTGKYGLNLRGLELHHSQLEQGAPNCFTSRYVLLVPPIFTCYSTNLVDHISFFWFYPPIIRKSTMNAGLVRWEKTWI